MASATPVTVLMVIVPRTESPDPGPVFEVPVLSPATAVTLKTVSAFAGKETKAINAKIAAEAKANDLAVRRAFETQLIDFIARFRSPV